MTEQLAENVPPVKTPRVALDSQRTGNSNFEAPQSHLDRWRLRKPLALQESSFSMQSHGSRCSSEHCYPTTNARGDYLSSRSTLPSKTDHCPEKLPRALFRDGNWNQKPYEQFDFHQSEPNAPIDPACVTNESDLIVDGQATQPCHEFEISYLEASSRRRFDSSMSVPMSDALPTLAPTSGDSVSIALSEAPCFSDHGPLSNTDSLTSSAPLYTATSPHLRPQSKPDQIQVKNRGCVSPSTCPSQHSAPDSADKFRDTIEWSTSISNATQSRRSQSSGSISVSELTMPSRCYSLLGQSLTSITAEPPHNMDVETENKMPVQPFPGFPMTFGGYPNGTKLMPAHILLQPPSSHGSHHDNSHQSQPQLPAVAPHDHLKLFQRNIECQSFHGHFSDFSEPLGLYPALHEEPPPPPPEDMNPLDPDLVPHKQSARFNGDMYTPTWVRGYGEKREGWCGICKPGRWLFLKNSAYWYDKVLRHGISVATGAPFQEPVNQRRMNGNPDICEGQCGSCNKWLPLVSRKAKRTKWFRHAYKCQSYAKRKREHPYLSLEGMHGHLQGSGTPLPTLPHGLPVASYATPGGTRNSHTSMPQYMRPQQLQQQRHPHHQTLGPLTPSQSRVSACY